MFYLPRWLPLGEPMNSFISATEAPMMRLGHQHTLSMPAVCAPRAMRPTSCSTDDDDDDDDDTFAGLIVCTNSNICGKSNPTNVYGYGFAFRAIECLRVLAP
jgi:hypothetical protein